MILPSVRSDLDKALNAIRDWFSATQMETQAQAQVQVQTPPSILTSTSSSTKQCPKIIQIYVYGALFGGIFDQEMASIGEAPNSSGKVRDRIRRCGRLMCYMVLTLIHHLIAAELV